MPQLSGKRILIQCGELATCCNCRDNRYSRSLWIPHPVSTRSGHWSPSMARLLAVRI